MLPYKINNKTTVARLKNKYLIRKYKIPSDEPDYKNGKMKQTILIVNTELKTYLSDYFFSDDIFPPDDPEMIELKKEEEAKKRKEIEDYCLENSVSLDEFIL